MDSISFLLLCYAHPYLFPNMYICNRLLYTLYSNVTVCGRENGKGDLRRTGTTTQFLIGS